MKRAVGFSKNEGFMKPSSKIPRKRKKMALYEVFSKGMSESRRKSEAGMNAENSKVAVGGASKRSNLPKVGMLQINRGRVEISVRYEVAVVVLLVVILCVMGAYRLGERFAVAENQAAQSQTNESQTMAAVEVSTAEPQVPMAESQASGAEETTDAAGSGDNWIVIATHRNAEQLTPVQQFFMGYGIETQIRRIGENYILHTRETYGNPNRRGSDGWQALRRIVEVGQNYEPLAGYRSFDFTTAYGMKKSN